MMLAAGLAVVLPTASAWLALRQTSARDLGAGFSVVAALGLGCGVSSLFWWVLLQSSIVARLLPYADLALWAVVLVTQLAMAPRRAAESPTTVKPRRSPSGKVVLAAGVLLFSATAMLAVASFASTTAVFPHGNWDAWAIWNSRARFLFLGLPDLWTAAFSPGLGWSHPDYPLLLPITVARLWAFIGHEVVAVPIATAAAFSAGLVAIIGFSVAREKSAATALLACAFLLASAAFLRSAPSQIADVPLAFFMLLALVFAWAAGGSPRPSGLWAFAGLSAGLAAWTKNEGIAFVIIFLVVCPLATRAGIKAWRRALVAVAAGAAGPLLVLWAFKALTAPPNDLMGRSIDQLLPLLTDGARLEIVLDAVGRELGWGGGTIVGVLPLLAVYVVAVGIRKQHVNARAISTLAVLGVLLIVYIGVYVTSPHDLAWHLKSSLDRVLLHLLPALIWIGFMVASTEPHPSD